MIRFLPLILLGLFAAACSDAPGEDHTHDDHGDHDHSGDAHGHTHEPNHGGALHPIGDHAAHFEITFDAATGIVEVYVYDGHLEQTLPIRSAELQMRIARIGETTLEEPAMLTLAAEAIGDAGEASLFRGRLPALEGASGFAGDVPGPISLRGQEYRDLPVRYPEGTEGMDQDPSHDHGDHDHSHDHDDHSHGE